jgi:hypothetical protein
MEFFYAMSKVTINNGKKERFWYSLWADGPQKPLRLPYTLSPKIKDGLYKKAMTKHSWVMQIDNSDGLSVQHLQEFVKLLGDRLE